MKSLLVRGDSRTASHQQPTRRPPGGHQKATRRPPADHQRATRRPPEGRTPDSNHLSFGIGWLSNSQKTLVCLGSLIAREVRGVDRRLDSKGPTPRGSQNQPFALSVGLPVGSRASSDPAWTPNPVLFLQISLLFVHLPFGSAKSI